VSQVLPDGVPTIAMATWLKHHLHVTKRKDDEPEGSTAFNQGNTVLPEALDFDRDLVDGESIRGEDLVAWVTMGNWHLPVAEDSPTTTTPGNRLSWVLKPFNFHDEDAGTDIGNIRLLSPDSGGKALDTNPLYTNTETYGDGCLRPVSNATYTRWQ
jgi:primary-amine oxidase